MVLGHMAGQALVESSLSLKNSTIACGCGTCAGTLRPRAAGPQPCTSKIHLSRTERGRKSWWIVSDGGETIWQRRSGYDVAFTERFAARDDRASGWASRPEGETEAGNIEIDRRQGGCAVDASKWLGPAVRQRKRAGVVAR